jgi:hypothetical protein
MSETELLALAVAAPPDSAERVLYAAAAFDALTVADLELVGGAAQLTYTGIGRLTDIELVGVVTAEDEAQIQAAGFRRDGRHWVYEAGGVAIGVEVPGDRLLGDEEPELVDLGGVSIAIISVTDLMMDRLVQATDGTAITYDEASQLAVAAGDRIDWDRIEERAARAGSTEPFLVEISRLAVTMRGLAKQSTE